MSDLGMWICVNYDLKMRPGKIAAQVGHCACAADRKSEAQNPHLHRAWYLSGHRKVVLRASEAKLLELLQRYPDRTVSIRDAGKTQVAPDSLTVIGFTVMAKEEIPELATLKLL